MSVHEDEIGKRERAMGEHLEHDAANNRKIMAFLQTRVKNAETLTLVEDAFRSSSGQTFNFGDFMMSVGIDGLYHILQRGDDGKFHQVELPDVEVDVRHAA